MKRRCWLWAAGSVFLIVTLLTSLTQVGPGERALVRRLGRILPVRPGPGLYVGLPWGIDRVDRVAIERVRRVTVGFTPSAGDDEGLAPAGQLVTGDHNLIDMQVEVYYAVHEDQLERFVLQAERADALVGRAAEAALVEWVAGQTVDRLVSGDRDAVQRWLAEQAQERLRAYHLGVQVQAATVTYISPPRDVKEAFAEVARAEMERGTAINQARQAARRRLDEAGSEAFRIARLAASYAEGERLLAQAEAEAFRRRREQYHRLRAKDPAYLNSLWWDEITRLYRRLRESGRIDLLDHHLGPDGLDITQMPALPKKR